MSTSRYPQVCPLPVSARELNGVAVKAPWPGASNNPGSSDDLGLVGEGVAMRRLRLQVRRIGPHFRAVLVSGEPGTEKELAARALHRMSRGAEGPFVVCDAATLESAESDDTSDASQATSDRIGWLMHRARQGTLFLEGIGDMPLDAQARLLRVLRRYEWAQEGSAATQAIGTRIIATTDQDLRILASAGRFRVELYQKIAMVGIAVPPLRERVEDIAQFAMHFLGRFAQLYERPATTISNDVLAQMKSYSWPGNINEMENVVRHGVLQCEGALLEARHLPSFGGTGSDAGVITGREKMSLLQDVVEHHVLQVLKDCAGNKLRAAESLGISRSTLYRMLDGCAAGGGVDAGR